MQHLVETGSAVSQERFFIGDMARHVGRRLEAAMSGLARHAFDRYRPERHYMRGPGPKWREKHGLAEAQSPIAPS